MLLRDPYVYDGDPRSLWRGQIDPRRDQIDSNSCAYFRSCSSVRGYVPRSSCAANCAGLTKILDTTTLHSLRACRARSCGPTAAKMPTDQCEDEHKG